MDSKDGAAVNIERSYEDFLPSVQWIKEECRVLEFSIPDFKKEHLAVKLDSHGNLKISGERPLDENKWKRFTHSISVPKDSKISDFNAKFSSGVLRVSLPKTVTKLQDDIDVQPHHQEASTTITTKTIPAITIAADAAAETSKQDQKSSSDLGSEVNGSTKLPGDLKADDQAEIIKGGEKTERLHRLPRSRLVTVAVVIVAVVVVGAFAKYMLGTFSGWEDLEGL